MQLNIPADDPNKAPWIPSDTPDTRCAHSYDDLWRRLAQSQYGQDVDKWRETFVLNCGQASSGGTLSAGNSDPVCRACLRRLSQHHNTSGAYQFSPIHNFCKRCPVSCAQVQSRLIRNRNQALQALQAQQRGGGIHGLGALGLMAFVDHPMTGEVLCRGCLFPIAEHSNGTDVADAMVNAMGGGMAGMMSMAHGMSGQGGPQMLGGHHHVQLTPQQQAVVDQREQILPVLVADEHAAGDCPYSIECLEEFDELSCFEKKKELWACYLQHKSQTQKHGNSETTTSWIACRNCGGKVRDHPSDPAKAAARAARDQWAPLSPEPCGITSGTFDTHRARLNGQQQGGGIATAVQGMVAQQALLQNPTTGAEVCGKCRWEVAQHPVGPDPSAQMQAAVNNMIGGMFSQMGMGGFAPQRQQQQQQQPHSPAPAESLYQAYPPQNQQQQRGDADEYVEIEEMEMCCGCIPRMVTKRVKRSEVASRGFMPVAMMRM